MIRIYNTLSGKKEILEPFDKAHGKKLKLFVCGPTVYDAAHIGHARTYLVFDMIAKYLKEKGYDVFYLQNITDVDDKIINRAKETKITPAKLASRFAKEYLKDMKSLRINGVNKYAEATEHIKEIIGQIKCLLKKGYAYRIEDGIYYDISKFKNYGKLSHRTASQAEDAVSRIDQAQGKRNKGDFCLWKISPSTSSGQVNPYEPSWRPAPVGRGSPSLPAGRPGWHIEDTAITEKYFGSQYDIHGGGRDLIFPHHEAEIAQMEAISGRKPMVKYWLHTGFLTVNGQKMSKSLGNFITIKDFIKEHSSRTLRFLILKNYYRSPIDYSKDSVMQAERELERIDEFITKLKTTAKNSKLSNYKREFDKAMEDDLNTPKAIAVIFELMRQRDSLNAEDTLEFLRQIDKFFDFIFWPKEKEKIPQLVLDSVKHREEYRKEGNWQKADQIRNEIKNLGWFVEDTKDGPKLKKII